MKNLLYKVELNHPDFYVEFEGPEGMTKNEILEKAINELTRKTELWKVETSPCMAV